MEKEIIEKYIKEYPTLSVGEIAVKLGISRNTLYSRMKGYGIVTGKKKGRKVKPLTVTV